MKKLFYILFTFCIALTACDFETSNNGDIDGYWQLSQLDTLTGGSTDMRHANLFWSVQVKLLEIRNIEAPLRSILCRFHQDGDSLRIWNPVFNDRNISDSLALPKDLDFYNLDYRVNAENMLESSLKIYQLDSERMVLTNSRFRFHFRKY